MRVEKSKREFIERLCKGLDNEDRVARLLANFLDGNPNLYRLVEHLSSLEFRYDVLDLTYGKKYANIMSLIDTAKKQAKEILKNTCEKLVAKAVVAKGKNDTYFHLSKIARLKERKKRGEWIHPDVPNLDKLRIIKDNNDWKIIHVAKEGRG